MMDAYDPDLISELTADEFMDMRPTGGFRVILADPPWKFKTYSENGEGKSPQAHYECLDTSVIAAFPVDVLAAKDCALFIWCTWPMMREWNRIIEAWGFTYAGLAWEWLKYNPVTSKYAFGGGFGTRKNLEPCLLATRGNPSLKADTYFFGQTEVAKGVHSVRDFIEAMPLDAIRAPRREHSRKPDEQYDRIETLFDGPYVELFARQRREGWNAWGNQVGLFGDKP